MDKALQEHFIYVIVLDTLRHFLVKVPGLSWSLILDHYLYIAACPSLLTLTFLASRAMLIGPKKRPIFGAEAHDRLPQCGSSSTSTI